MRGRGSRHRRIRTKQNRTQYLIHVYLLFIIIGIGTQKPISNVTLRYVFQFFGKYTAKNSLWFRCYVYYKRRTKLY